MRSKALGILTGILWFAAVATLGISITRQHAHAATVGDPRPAARYGAVNILNSAATAIPATNRDRNALMIQNRGPNSIFCGWDSSVDNTTGMEVPTNTELTIDIVTNTGITNNPVLFCKANTADQTSPLNTRFIEVK